MFPLLALAALAGFAGYQYSKAKNGTKTIVEKATTNDSDTSNAKNVNNYNYYTTEAENGNTLFGTDKKQKRTLFGGETL